MAPRIKIGERHGKLVALSRHPSGTYRHPKYLVRCDCGNEYATTSGNFRFVSGCIKCSHGGAKRKYGVHRIMQGSKLYHSWIAMRRRCDLSVEPTRNARWAGRGISVCQEWQDSFVAFESWSLAHGYCEGLSLDRINSDGNYEPSNCEWVTRSVNSKRCRAEYEFVRKNRRHFEPGITQWL